MNDELEKLMHAERELINKVLADILKEDSKEEQKRRYNQIDHIPEGFKIWESRYFGRRYVARANGCLFCKKCDDIVLDSCGPYMLHCKLDMDTETGMAGKCEKFEEE